MPMSPKSISCRFRAFVGAATVLGLLLFSGVVPAQTTDVSEDIRFARYLMENKSYNDAVYVLSRMSRSQKISDVQADSISFLMGYSHFSRRSVDSAVGWLSKVGAQSALHPKALFYNAFGRIYLGQLDSARRVLDAYSFSGDSALLQLKTYQEAAVSVLDRDFTSYDRIRKSLVNPYYPVAAEVRNLEGYAVDLKRIRRRSPAVAGLLSAVIPGAGKIYAGYRMQGLAAFAQVLVFGAAAAESYVKHPAGPGSARFIALGSLFSIFYIGNIWGSVLSVRIKRNEQYREIDQSILVDLRVPLVRLFN